MLVNAWVTISQNPKTKKQANKQTNKQKQKQKQNKDKKTKRQFDMEILSGETGSVLFVDLRNEVNSRTSHSWFVS